MSETKISEAIRNLIVCDTQFGWTGETTLKLPELLDLQARGWLIEGDENCEFSLTDEGQAVVARALQQDAPAELAEQQGDSSLNTSEGGRRYVADYFARELRRHDFARYITTTLAADFACVLAQHLAATGKQQAGEPEIEFQARLMDVKTDLPTENWRHSPTYDENPGRGTHYWVQFRKRYIYYTPPTQGIDLGQLWEPIKEAVHTALSVHVSAMSQKKREQVAVYVARQLRDCQRDAAPGVGNG